MGDKKKKHIDPEDHHHEEDEVIASDSNRKKKTKKGDGEEQGKRKKDDGLEEGEQEGGKSGSIAVDVTDNAASEAKKRKRKRARKKKGNAGEGEGAGEGEDDGEDTGGAEANDEASIDLAGRTIYVEGISYEATEDDLTRFFQDKGCGKVLSVRMPRWQDSGRPRGYAHIDFKKVQGVEKALELNGQHMKGRYLTIERANETKSHINISTSKPPGCQTIFVKNLPYDAGEEAIREAFTFCGKIKTVRLAVNTVTQHQKGFCYIEFMKESAAEIAVKKQSSITVGGRPVYIDYETGKPKGSYRNPTEGGKGWSKAGGRAGGKR